MGKLPWQRAVVVGASSGIGAALARELARAGCQLALVARREPELRRLRDEIDPGGDRVSIYPHDVRRPDEAPRMLDAIATHLDGLDLVVYSAGIMPRIGPDEYTFATDAEIVGTNLLGAIAWLNEAVRRFTAAGAGTIVGISSASDKQGLKEIDGKTKYSDWEFVYDPSLDTSRIAANNPETFDVDDRLRALR